MINNNIDMNFATKHLPLEYKLLEWKLMINQELYDEIIIDFEVKSEMERNILGRMTKIINECNKKKDLILSSLNCNIQLS